MENSKINSDLGKNEGFIQLSKFRINDWYTTDLVLNVMETVARHLKLDIYDNAVSDKLYSICSDLEQWPEDQGFGSSDHYGYIKQAADEFNLIT